MFSTQFFVLISFLQSAFAFEALMSQSASNLDSIVRPIDVILDGSNYSMWAQKIEVFLKGRRLWRYVTGVVPKPMQKDNEKEEFASRMEEWDSIHYKIQSWFINTSIPSINSLLPRLGIFRPKDTTAPMMLP